MKEERERKKFYCINLCIAFLQLENDSTVTAFSALCYQHITMISALFCSGYGGVCIFIDLTYDPQTVPSTGCNCAQCHLSS